MDDQIFSQLQSFLEKSNGLQQFFNYIPWTSEFEVRVGKAHIFTLIKHEQTWHLENCAAEKPHAVVTLTPEGLETILKTEINTTEQAFDVFLKLSLASLVSVDFKGPALNLLSTASSELCQATSEKLHQVLKSFGLENWSQKITRQ